MLVKLVLVMKLMSMILSGLHAGMIKRVGSTSSKAQFNHILTTHIKLTSLEDMDLLKHMSN